MTWLVFAFVGITIWSATAVADRFFLIRHVTSKRFYVVVPALLQFLVTLVLALLFFSIPHASMSAVATAVASGALEVVFLYYLYVAVSSDEVSRVFPLTAAGPIITLVLGWIVLHETLTSHQMLAFGLFLLGGFFLAAKFEGRSASFSKAIKPLFIGSALTSIFTLLLRSAFVQSGFWAGFFYSRLGFFIGGIIVLLIYRAEIVAQWKTLSTEIRSFLIGNQLAALSGHAFYFLALSLASAALVQSVLSAQSAIILVFAVFISFWKKDIIEESLRGRDLLQKAIGITFIIIASYLLAL